MFRKCCVSKCNSIRQDVKLHRFPVREENKSRWLQCLDFETLQSLEKADVCKLHVCHKHFEKRFLLPSNRLKSDAYPSLFTETEISSGHPSTSPLSTTVVTVTNPLPLDHDRHRRHHDHTYNKQYAGNAETSIPVLDTVTNEASHTMPSTSGFITRHASTETGVSSSNIHSSVASSNIATSSVSDLLKTPARSIKRKIVKNVNSLTPKCKMLYTEFKKARRQRDYKSRVKRALQFSKEKSLEDLSKNMNPLAKKLLWMQVKLCTKNKKGRRFTMDEKLIGLSVYKQSPKAYKFLQKIFILPSKTTLKKIISQLNIEAGINPQIFNLIKQQVQTWDNKRKLCTIMFDEMALESNVTYSANKDKIYGFVDLAEKTTEYADHALVFMLRGAVCKWQQPIAFYFCEGQTSSLQLKQIIKNVVAAVSESGLQPIALVSDQGSSFQSALNSLTEDTKRDQLCAGKNVDDTIHLNGHKLSVFYDPPHLIKGIRNNFLTKDIVLGGKRATWQDIVDVYNHDCNHGESRILHRLTDEHVIPEKIKKMKVKNCVRVLSKSVAAALSFSSMFPLNPDGSPVSKTLRNTSEIVSFMDDLFDSVNGANSTGNVPKSLRRAVTSKSEHHKFWDEALIKLKNMQFVTKDGQSKSVPSLKNWVITLKSYQRVWKLLKAKNIKIMRPRYFNSDPIENFFGQVRAYNYRSNDPSVYAFMNTFKSLLITRFINFHSENYNCENDSSNELLTIHSLFKKDNDTSPVQSETADTANFNVYIFAENIQEQARRERLNVHSRAYTAGWVTRKILKKINCSSCRDNLITDNDNDANTWINHKEFKALKQRKLSYPAENVVRSFGYIIRETNEFLEQNAHVLNLSEKIKQMILSKHSFEFLNCPLHKDKVLDYLLIISVKLFIHNWCNVINKILKGSDVSRLHRRQNLPPLQSKALTKYKKKLKNKNLNK